jgi:glycosyltransferase involved in cell wall biosynthesis
MTARDPLVSIVVPCHVRSPHELALLDETLTTVDHQDWSSYEVIVVDDGSPLEIGMVANRHASTTLVRQVNAGCAAARNTGIRLMRGDFVVFLDADDHLLPPAIRTGVEQLLAYPGCGFTVGPREEMTYEGTPVPWTVPVPPVGGDIYNALLGFDWYIIPPSSTMFRREVVAQLGGFRDPWGADDLDLYLRAARRWMARCFQAPAVTRYRRYSTSSSRDGRRMLRSIRAVYAREWPHVAGDPEGEAAFQRGLQRLTDIFLDCVVENLCDRVRAGQWRSAAESAAVLARESPRRLFHGLRDSAAIAARSHSPPTRRRAG